MSGAVFASVTGNAADVTFSQLINDLHCVVAVIRTEVTYHWPITALSVTVQTQCPFHSVYY